MPPQGLYAEQIAAWRERSTDPDGLLAHVAPLGDERKADGAIMDAIERCSLVICAWGESYGKP